MDMSSPGDRYEQQADKIAEQMIRMTQSDEARNLNIDKLQAKGGSGNTVPTDVEKGIKQLKGKGNPMNKPMRDFFEPRLGVDLGNVRIHTGTNANALARSVNARAFTYENDIVFGKGQYQFGTTEGKKLLAHELVHSVQQGNGLKKNEQIFRRKTNGSPASIDSIKQEFESLHNKWSLGAKDGVNLFVTSEIEKRMNRIEKESVGDFLVSFLGNAIWAAAAFVPAGWPAFVVAMTGISIASLPQVSKLLDGDKSTNIITATQASMYAYIDFYERRLNDKAREYAEKIKKDNPNCSLELAQTIYLRETFGAIL
jgi:hypothetical protein